MYKLIELIKVNLTSELVRMWNNKTNIRFHVALRLNISHITTHGIHGYPWIPPELMGSMGVLSNYMGVLPMTLGVLHWECFTFNRECSQ
jgi:hypothetical protein